MADITNPQIVTFANERARTIADAIEVFSEKVDAFVADYAAQGMTALITAAGASELVADGSEADGRQRITGTKIINLRAALLQLQTALMTTAVSGVGSTPKVIADGIQVNGSPR
jgi:hypothetical protein